MDKEHSLVFRIVQYSLEQPDEIIVKGNMYVTLGLNEYQQQYVGKVLSSGFEQNTGTNINSNHIMVRTSDSNSAISNQWQYRMSPTALDSYYNYIELKEARKNANDARKYSIWAIIIALLSLGVASLQFLFEFFRDKARPVLDNYNL